MNTSRVQIVEVFDKGLYDPAGLCAHAPFTQAYFYGEWQRAVGRTVRRFVIREHASVVGSVQIILYRLPFGKLYAYAPYGPVFANSPSPEVLAEFARFCLEFARKEGAVFLRLDPTVCREKCDDVLWQQCMRKAPHASQHASQVQPRAEWRLDVSVAPEELLQQFHKNTRYSIRVSEKHGIETRIIDHAISSVFETFFDILQETSRRDGFSLHPRAYYEAIFSQCDKDENAIVVLSSYKDRVLAANLVVMYGNTAMFVFGGTRSEHRDLMPAYAAQWATMRFLHEKQVRWYNFGGVTDDLDKRAEWRGLTAFKKRFGGELLQHSMLYDVVAQPLWYFLYTIYKRFR